VSINALVNVMCWGSRFKGTWYCVVKG